MVLIAYSAEGLPIAVEVAAKPCQDHLCISVANLKWALRSLTLFMLLGNLCEKYRASCSMCYVTHIQLC